MLDKLPNDPVMLLSVINTELRDNFSSLDALCENINISKDELIEKLYGIDYEYDEAQNQFV